MKRERRPSKSRRHPFHRFLIDTRLMDGHLRRLLHRLASAKPDRCSYEDSRRRLAAEMGHAGRPAFALKAVWAFSYAGLLAVAVAVSYDRGLSKGLEASRLAKPSPIIARVEPSGTQSERSRPPHPQKLHTRSRRGKGVANAKAQFRPTVEDLAQAVKEELPVVEESAQAYENLAQSETDPERKVEALSRAADIYDTLLNDTHRAMSTYRHQVSICQRFLAEATEPNGKPQVVDEAQAERLRLRMEKAQLEIAIVRAGEEAGASSQSSSPGT